MRTLTICIKKSVGIFFTKAVCLSAVLCWLLIMNMGCSINGPSHFEQKAKVEITNLSDAIKLFKIDNGVLPAMTENRNDYRVDNISLYATLSNTHTKRGPYLLMKGPLIDPWGQQYIVWFDGNNDGIVNIEDKVSVNQSFAIWSIGENGKNEYGNYDDITNWSVDGL